LLLLLRDYTRGILPLGKITKVVLRRSLRFGRNSKAMGQVPKD
jgi:hypothetical protein